MQDVKFGLIFCLLGSDRPIYESFAPNLIDQRDAMEKQFIGMTDIEFSYEEFEDTRLNLIERVNEVLTEQDKAFLISFENGEPDWSHSEYESFKDYPSVKWKLLNIEKLKIANPKKLKDEVTKLRDLFCR